MSPETVKVLGMRVGDIRPLTKAALAVVVSDTKSSLHFYDYDNSDDVRIETSCDKTYIYSNNLIHRIL
ncbi:hypothetical protein vBYenM531-1_14 [Yersinia phage vB_YenM_531]|nr:hypothetical protein X1_43 [Yersinia phage vB_Yen_X1]QKN86993.1 hypothetical protein vBYenM531-1_14 [Yersinia phage vB_YenM_531]QKN87085.1 hypothetical protein vBYenM534_14 [Yersinia phage vB_YenM_534]QKN87449.1 hypothetical protein vBYenM281_014 [Yersinia phage vB_YenM_281]CAJ28412.1 hypothetical protein [Yersinia phage PY100]